MKLTEVYRDENALVQLNQEEGLLQLTWLQHVSGEPMRAVLETALQYGRAAGISRWLFDMRRMHYVTLADQAWSLHVYFPSFDLERQHRLACLAARENFDMIPDTFIQDGLQHYKELTGSMQLRVVLEMELAQYWLLLE